jgi:hypothetical protein
VVRLVFGMNQSLDGYVDQRAFAPSPTLFRHFIEEAQGQAGSTAGNTWSTRCAARSAIRRPPQLGHTSRALHEKGTSRSRAH